MSNKFEKHQRSSKHRYILTDRSGKAVVSTNDAVEYEEQRTAYLAKISKKRK